MRSPIFLTHSVAGELHRSFDGKTNWLSFLLFNVKQKASSQILSMVEHRRKCKRKQSTEQVELQCATAKLYTCLFAILADWCGSWCFAVQFLNYLTLYSWIEVWNCFSSITHYLLCFHVSSYSTHQNFSTPPGVKVESCITLSTAEHKPWLFSHQSHESTLTHHTCTAEEGTKNKNFIQKCTKKYKTHSHYDISWLINISAAISSSLALRTCKEHLSDTYVGEFLMIYCIIQ